MMTYSNLNFFYNFASDMNTLVFKSKDRLYNKIKDLTVIIMTFIPILFGLGYFCINNYIYQALLIPISLTLTCLGISALIGFYILWNNQFHYNDPLKLIDKYHEKNTSFITLKTASSLAYITNLNCEEHNKMARSYQWMIFVVGISIINTIFTFWLAILTILLN